MKDVASLAKVSSSTVSRSISQPDRVDAETLGRVQAAITTLGYVPDGVARSLRTQRTETIGMCIPKLGHSTFAETVERMQAELRSAGYTLLLSIAGYDRQQEATEVTAMIQRGVDGIVLIGGYHDAQLIALMKARALPYVVLWSTHDDHPSIGFDHRRAMVQLTTHLTDLGHRRIATIMADVAQNDRIRDRLLGVGDALAARGFAFPAAYQRITQTGLTSAGHAMSELLALPNPPTAVACVNDVVAVGAALECQRQGVRIPRDMSITGFGALEIGAAQSPPITTIHTPIDMMCKRAARYLVDRIAGQPATLQELLPTEILVRDSTAPPAPTASSRSARPSARAARK
jgi:LacI family transcriptional regulator